MVILAHPPSLGGHFNPEKRQNMDLLASWKTTLTGIGTVAGGIATVIAGLTHSPVDLQLVLAGGTAVAAGIGLILAKDKNVSNASRPVEARVVEPTK